MSSLDHVWGDRQRHGGPAFPHEKVTGRDPMGATMTEYFPGATLRDYIAVQAPDMPDNYKRKEKDVQKVVPDGSTGRKRITTVKEWEEPAQHLARWAYAYADAMLAERAK
jgi:hypothetical protein